MSLVTRTIEHLRTLNALEPRGAWVLAVSGGVDSMAMLHLFRELRERWELELHAVYIDHGLRPEAAAEGAYVRDTATEWGISSYIAAIDVKLECAESGGSIQEVARRLRYDVLDRMRNETAADFIATAHHADDQAETLLARFLTGAGPEGLGGIHPVNGVLVRPLLWALRSDIVAYAKECGIHWMEDASNSEPKYQRNIIRSEVIPGIQRSVNPGLARTLSRSAEMFRAFDAYHHSIALRLFAEVAEESGPDIRLAVQPLIEYFEAEQLLVLRLAVERAGCERAGYAHIQALRTLLAANPGSRVQLPGGLLALRERETILLTRATLRVDDPVEVHLGESVEALGLKFTAQAVDSDEIAFTRNTMVEFIDGDVAGDTWTLRRWQHGDSFQPIGFPRRVKVSDLLTDAKLSPAAKPEVVVLERDGEILWVCGVRLSDSVKMSAGTVSTVRLSIEPLSNEELQE